MAKKFLNGIAIAEISALPDFASNAGVLLRQNGKLWYSDGTAWYDLAATGSGGGSQEVFVQQTRPAGNGPWMWWETDAGGEIIDLTVANGTA